ncbi:MAG TPA: hypothetical protein VFO18_08905, partial [Methylomirabilota bacterium]|nr:hypothetical protein [Methylomirabilota bacterium]
MDPHDPPWPEGRAKNIVGQADHRCMWSALRFANEKLTPDQLDSVAGLESAEIHEPLVLEPCPALRADGRSGHVLGYGSRSATAMRADGRASGELE